MISVDIEAPRFARAGSRSNDIPVPLQPPPPLRLQLLSFVVANVETAVSISLATETGMGVVPRYRRNGLCLPYRIQEERV